MESVGEGKYIRTVDSQFLIFPLRKCLHLHFGRLFAATLSFVASSAHLKLKYHNLQGDPTIIIVVMNLSVSFFKPIVVSNDSQRRIYGIALSILRNGEFSEVYLGFKMVHFLEVENHKTRINSLNKWFIIW